MTAWTRTDLHEASDAMQAAENAFIESQSDSDYDTWMKAIERHTAIQRFVERPVGDR